MNLFEWATKWGVTAAAIDDLRSVFATLPVAGSYDESVTQAKLRIMAPQQRATLWRNNQGAMVDKTDRIVRYGLGNDSARINAVFKSSDLIGITPVEWKGRFFGVFTAVEVKRPDWKFSEADERAVAQRNFLMTVQSLGGIGIFARSVDDYTATLGVLRNG